MSEVHISDPGNSLERVNKILGGLGSGNQVFRAVSAAAKRAAQSARAKAGQFASEEYFISSGGFKGHVTDKVSVDSGGGSVSVKIEFAGTVIPLIEFQTVVSNGGVSAHVRKDSGGGMITNAFFGRIGGRTGVYQRAGKDRYPIKKLYSVSSAHMMQHPEVIEKMDERITEVFADRIEHEITRILNGW